MVIILGGPRQWVLQFRGSRYFIGISFYLSGILRNSVFKIPHYSAKYSGLPKKILDGIPEEIPVLHFTSHGHKHGHGHGYGLGHGQGHPIDKNLDMDMGMGMSMNMYMYSTYLSLLALVSSGIQFRDNSA